MDRNLNKGGTQFHVIEPTKRDSNQNGSNARTQKPPDSSHIEERAKQQDALKRGEFLRQIEYGGAPRQGQ
jgi:hypothetical protein